MPDLQEMDSSRKFQHIQPAPPSSSEPTEEVPGGVAGEGFPFPSKRQRRSQVKTACDTCRTKKTKRPVCAACLKRGTGCTFDGVPAEADELTESDELLSLLTSALTEEEVMTLLSDIKHRNNFSESLKHLKTLRDERLFEDTSGTDLALAPDQDSLEFELMTRHSLLFPASVALDKNLLSQKGSSSSHSADAVQAGSHQASSSTVAPRAQPVKLFDPRLRNVEFSTWTDVSIDNLDAARLISKYLEVDHPVLGLFDHELFLADLSTGQKRFCTSFLVNAILSWGFLQYLPPKSPGGPSESSKFFTRARGQWVTGSMGDSFPAVAGLQLLSLAATFSGQGPTAKKLLFDGIDMAKRLDLLSSGDKTPKSARVYSTDELKAASSAAWGLFCHTTLHALHCQKCELWSIGPPTLPIPASNDPTTLYYLCQLWTIVHDILREYFSPERISEPARYDIQFAQTTFHRLLDWGSCLPLTLARGNKTTYQGAILHIYFHAASITLLRPLVLFDEDSAFTLDTGSKRPAKDFLHASSNQLKRLVSLYQANFSHTSELSILWHTGCLFVANAVIRDVTSPTSRLHFWRCLYGYKSLYPKSPLVKSIAKGLLLMAVMGNLITKEEACREIGEFQSGNDGEHSYAMEPTEACFVVDLDLGLSDAVGSHVDSLAQNFDDMFMDYNE
ncbi:unnamed protein product [Clonostachys chloroleuca]|uniref:Zn(2)-C6 fungal-type domain-containing protein n=1 Tax=Clonostachys chloroleuca TaxID=1926264 RepID=A0AA35LZE3_9HYPO|nr:unnamed protein product [Clonostachys chloroleuca]